MKKGAARIGMVLVNVSSGCYRSCFSYVPMEIAESAYTASYQPREKCDGQSLGTNKGALKQAFLEIDAVGYIRRRDIPPPCRC